jgi:hypothetical protein
MQQASEMGEIGSFKRLTHCVCKLTDLVERAQSCGLASSGRLVLLLQNRP